LLVIFLHTFLLDLFVEILLECGEFVFAKEATLPPGAEESGAVAGELDE